MRKIREVLRLRFQLGLGQRAIARACSISQSTVHDYLNRAAAAGMVWPPGEEWDEQRVEQALFGERQVVKRLPEQVLPDFPALHSQLQQHRHLTLQLAWEEYRQVHPEGYGYSRFCELYQRWRRKQDVVLRQVHQPGEKGFVDGAGATIPMHDPVTGEVWPASLFVMVLGTSSYTYAEATRDQQLTAWISATAAKPSHTRDRLRDSTEHRSNRAPNRNSTSSSPPAVGPPSCCTTPRFISTFSRTVFHEGETPCSGRPRRGKRWPSRLLWLTTRSCPYPTPDEAAARSGPPASPHLSVSISISLTPCLQGIDCLRVTVQGRSCARPKT
jgi:hypothetical protein